MQHERHWHAEEHLRHNSETQYTICLCSTSLFPLPHNVAQAAITSWPSLPQQPSSNHAHKDGDIHLPTITSWCCRGHYRRGEDFDSGKAEDCTTIGRATGFWDKNWVAVESHRT